MTVKEKLLKYSYAVEYADELQDKIQIIRDRMTSIKSINTDGIVASGGNGDKIGETIAKLVDLEQDYLSRMCELTDLEADVERMIAGLSEREQKLIRLRYVKHKKWEDICVEMNYSWRGIHKLHGRILAKLEKGTEVNYEIK